jgi:hypothetical protein
VACNGWLLPRIRFEVIQREAGRTFCIHVYCSCFSTCVYVMPGKICLLLAYNRSNSLLWYGCRGSSWLAACVGWRSGDACSRCRKLQQRAGWPVSRYAGADCSRGWGSSRGRGHPHHPLA